jgi:hypothetical protein
MDMNEISPNNPQQIFQMLATLIANYRDGQAGRAFFDQVGALSAEWENQSLPCAVAKHGRRDRFENAPWRTESWRHDSPIPE